MTPGSSCGGWNVLVEGFTLQSNSAIHYDAAFVYILYNQESRNKFSAHPDEHLSCRRAVGVSRWLHLGPAAHGATCQLRRWFALENMTCGAAL